jgi:hypothetical protein
MGINLESGYQLGPKYWRSWIVASRELLGYKSQFAWISKMLVIMEYLDLDSRPGRGSQPSRCVGELGLGLGPSLKLRLLRLASARKRGIQAGVRPRLLC